MGRTGSSVACWCVTGSGFLSSPDSARPQWMSNTVDVVRATYQNWRDARTVRLGAGIAYYALFAVVPLITLSIWFAQFVVEDSGVRDFVEKLGSELNINDEAVAAFVDTLNASSALASSGLIGFCSLAFTVVLVFIALRDAFDELWGLPVARGVKNKLHRRCRQLSCCGFTTSHRWSS